jgi:hypothetical protein
MAISAAPLEIQAKKPFASTLKVKGEVQRSSTRLKTSWFSRRACIKVLWKEVGVGAAGRQPRKGEKRLCPAAPRGEGHRVFLFLAY